MGSECARRVRGCVVSGEAHSTESVPIRGLTVEVGLQRDGDPLVIVMTRKVEPGRAALVVSARGMDEAQLCAVLSTITTTLEHPNGEPSVNRARSHPVTTQPITTSPVEHLRNALRSYGLTEVLASHHAGRLDGLIHDIKIAATCENTAGLARAKVVLDAQRASSVDSTDYMRHPFDPGHTGMSETCNRLVFDDERAGVECGLTRDRHESGADDE